MTNKRNIVLTAEEQVEISQNLPQLFKAIEQGSPIASAWLASWRSRHGVADEAQAQAKEIRQEIMKAPPEQGVLQQWCGFPTDMTRCSPFFPMNPKELGQRPYLENFIITSANWGEIKYTGPKLSTYEEDVLLSVLAILDGQSKEKIVSHVYEATAEYNEEKDIFEKGSYVSETPIEGFTKKTYTYRGAILPLLRLLGIERPGKTNYIRFLSALKRLTVAGIELSISAGKTKSGKKRSPRITHMSNMLSGFFWDDKSKILMVTINPFFYEMYMSGRITLMDVSKRMSLKGVITKSLYRFIQSQQNGFTGHFLTLADALNMDRKQPQKETRRQLKKAINELIEHRVLTKKSDFLDDNIVTLMCVPMTKQKNIIQHIE